MVTIDSKLRVTFHQFLLILYCETRSGPNIPAVGYWRGVILRDLTGDLWPQNGLLVAFFGLLAKSDLRFEI